jgi:hypothetical protein
LKLRHTTLLVTMILQILLGPSLIEDGPLGHVAGWLVLSGDLSSFGICWNLRQEISEMEVEQSHHELILHWGDEQSFEPSNVVVVHVNSQNFSTHFLSLEKAERACQERKSQRRQKLIWITTTGPVNLIAEIFRCIRVAFYTQATLASWHQDLIFLRDEVRSDEELDLGFHDAVRYLIPQLLHEPLPVAPSPVRLEQFRVIQLWIGFEALFGKFDGIGHGYPNMSSSPVILAFENVKPGKFDSVYDTFAEIPYQLQKQLNELMVACEVCESWTIPVHDGHSVRTVISIPLDVIILRLNPLALPS